MAIEQERAEAAISELHCQTPTRLAQEGKCDLALLQAKLRNLYNPRSSSALAQDGALGINK